MLWKGALSCVLPWTPPLPMSGSPSNFHLYIFYIKDISPLLPHMGHKLFCLLPLLLPTEFFNGQIDLIFIKQSFEFEFLTFIFF